MKQINQIWIRKISDTSEPVKKLDYNTNINKIESKIPNIGDLATNVPLTAVDNKMPNIGNLVKKTDYNTKRVKLKKKLLIKIMINILIFQNLINLQQKFLMHSQHKQTQ